MFTGLSSVFKTVIYYTFGPGLQGPDANMNFLVIRLSVRDKFNQVFLKNRRRTTSTALKNWSESVFPGIATCPQGYGPEAGSYLLSLYNFITYYGKIDL